MNSERTLHRAVRKLYKQLIFVGKHFPLPGIEKVRKKAKTEFMKHRDEKDEEKIKELIAWGRFSIREIEALNQLHRYRNLKKKYYD